MTVQRNIISLEKAKSFIRYEPETGFFFWIVEMRSGVKPGQRAGYHGKYVRIGIDGRRYSASCLAWLFMTGEWPELEIDHIDLNKTNNRWKNLRLATHAQNQQNVLKKKHWKSGYKGVRRYKNRWQAKIVSNGKSKNLGFFDNPHVAYEAYREAATREYKEFARLI